MTPAVVIPRRPGLGSFARIALVSCDLCFGTAPFLTRAHDLRWTEPGDPTWFGAATADSGPSRKPMVALNQNGTLMVASFGSFRPRVRFFWDATTFYLESDGLPANAFMPSLMVGITSWQQQVPVPTAYFASTTNPEGDPASLGYGQPNVWRLPLAPTPGAAPIPILATNFLRGAIAIAADGVPIFNPHNNTGRISYEIGELDQYGGHCGLADDYHYHIAPVHLQKVLGPGRPIAWALDGYPMYGYTEPDGTARLALDANGGHAHGSWGYHYHAIGSAQTGPQSPYLPTAFYGTVVNYGGQVDGQPEVSPIRASGTGGYTAQPVNGASIVAYQNPAAFATDAQGNLIASVTGAALPDQYLMRVAVGAATADVCWQFNRTANPKTLKMTWRLPTGSVTTTTTYNSTGGRITTYPMAGWSLLKLPDTGQTIHATSTFGEDSDYTINAPSYTDNRDGTVTDNVTGLMWQKVDSGETTWANAVAQTGNVRTGGYSDWRLPTPTELFSIMDHNEGNPAALNLTYFPSNPAGTADYWWTSDIYGSDAAHVWCVNSGGGMGPKPLTETLSAGGSFRYNVRYVRGPNPGNGHNYFNNLDGTITDTDTGLMWAQVPGPAMTWNAALTYAQNLRLGGYTDWRLPNIKELQTLADYTLATATTAATARAPVNRILFPTASTPATAYWSSTALVGNGSTYTQAWLQEFGINNAVPAANGPTRNFQGIISYEVMTSSYPVFAVRTANQVSAPVITAQPAPQTVASGATAVFTAMASGSPAPTYQWQLGGSTLPGATSSQLVVSGASAAQAGLYACVVSNAAGSITSAAAALSIVTTTNVGRLINLSVNATAGISQRLTLGFVSGGAGTAGPETLLLRAIGPALTAFGVTVPLADPTLALLSGQTVIAANDNWGVPTSNQAAVAAADTATGAFALNNGTSLDAALVTTVPAGAYTMQVSGNTAASGTTVTEVYDATSGAAYTPASPRLTNLSVLNQVATGGFLTAGFVVGGATSKTVLIRATGPALAALGVSGTMPDPQIALHTSVSGKDMVLAANAGWGGDPQIAAVSASVGAFAIGNSASKDSVVLTTLAPGSYTAVASSVSGAAGNVLIEVYEVP